MIRPVPIGTLLDTQREIALVYARKWNALDDDGRLLCIACNHYPGTLPSLCCAGCLERRRGG